MSGSDKENEFTPQPKFINRTLPGEVAERSRILPPARNYFPPRPKNGAKIGACFFGQAE
jgi:hypothetical protein